MNKLLCLFVCIILSNNVIAQKVYKAVYRQIIDNIGVNTGTRDYFLKQLVNNSCFICVSNQMYNRRSLIESLNDNKFHNVDINNKLKIHESGEAYDIFDYDALRVFSYVSFNHDTTYENYKIDTSKLNFVKTNETKKINAWKCYKYINPAAKSNDIVLWVSDEIEWFINPGIFLPNISGGIVMIEFKNKNRIQLQAISIDSSNVLNEIRPELYKDNNKIYDLFDFQIKEL
jgi:GLPGLI family protein